MDTVDIPKDGPSDWRREPSEQRNALLGKLGEESSELAARCLRSMIQGLDERDPGDGRTNLRHLEDEIADVEAQIRMAKHFLGLELSAIDDRRHRKYAYKLPWIRALPDERPAQTVNEQL